MNIRLQRSSLPVVRHRSNRACSVRCRKWIVVLGNQEKLSAASYRPDLFADTPRVLVNDISSARETAPQFISGFSGRTRAIFQVQNGCDHRCTFCIIPYGRGPSRSVGMGAIVEEARRLCALGYREIVLSGIDLTDWGVGLPGNPTLGTLDSAPPQTCSGAAAPAPVVDRSCRS